MYKNGQSMVKTDIFKGFSRNLMLFYVYDALDSNSSNFSPLCTVKDYKSFD